MHDFVKHNHQHWSHFFHMQLTHTDFHSIILQVYSDVRKWSHTSYSYHLSHPCVRGNLHEASSTRFIQLGVLAVHANSLNCSTFHTVIWLLWCCQPINGVSSKQSEAFCCILMYLIIKPIRNTERAAALMNFIRHFKRDCHRGAFFFKFHNIKPQSEHVCQKIISVFKKRSLYISNQVLLST